MEEKNRIIYVFGNNMCSNKTIMLIFSLIVLLIHFIDKKQYIRNIYDPFEKRWDRERLHLTKRDQIMTLARDGRSLGGCCTAIVQDLKYKW